MPPKPSKKMIPLSDALITMSIFCVVLAEVGGLGVLFSPPGSPPPIHPVLVCMLFVVGVATGLAACSVQDKDKKTGD